MLVNGFGIHDYVSMRSLYCIWTRAAPSIYRPIHSLHPCAQNNLFYHVAHTYTCNITTRTQAMKVVGFHFVGPNAGEITQGFSLALKVCRCVRLFVVPTAQQGWVLVFWVQTRL